MKRLPILVALVIATAGCSGEAESLPTTQPTVPTAAPTTPSTTTTTIDVFEVTVIGDGPPGLIDAITNAYEVAGGVAEPEQVATGLATHLAQSSPVADIDAAYITAVEGLEDGWVGVGMWESDVVLATSEDGQSWTVVGSRLDSVGSSPYYGSERHQLFVIGSDARTREDPLTLRADSLHIISVAADGSSASIVGLPRDSYVETPYGSKTKFTNVMSGRGPEVAVETGEMLTGLDFDGYLVTGFAGFVSLVNGFGGMEVDIPFAMAEPKSKAYFEAGIQMIDGAGALAFARNRTLAGGDFTRQFHHGVIMQWGLAAVQERGLLAVPANIGLLKKHTFTDLSNEQLLLVFGALFERDPFEIPNLVVDGTPGYAGEASVVFLNDSAFTVFEDLADGVLDTVPEP